LPELNFGQQLRRVRQRRRITQEELGGGARMSQRQIARIEAGAAPGPSTHDKLLGALGFVYDSEPRTPQTRSPGE